MNAIIKEKIEAQTLACTYLLPGQKSPRHWRGDEGKNALLDAMEEGAEVEEREPGVFVARFGDEVAIVAFHGGDTSKCRR